MAAQHTSTNQRKQAVVLVFCFAYDLCQIKAICFSNLLLQITCGHRIDRTKPAFALHIIKLFADIRLCARERDYEWGCRCSRDLVGVVFPLLPHSHGFLWVWEIPVISTKEPDTMYWKRIYFFIFRLPKFLSSLLNSITVIFV